MAVNNRKVAVVGLGFVGSASAFALHLITEYPFCSF